MHTIAVNSIHQSSRPINTARYLAATLSPVLIFLALSISFVLMINDDIEFTEDELAAIEYLHPLYECAYKLQQIRGLGYQLLQGDGDEMVESQIKVLQQEFENMSSHSNVEHAHQFYPLARMDEILLKGKMLYATQFAEDSNTEQMFEGYTALIFEHFIVLKHLARESRLMLDPVLESYTLIDLVVSRIPEITEEIGRLRGRSGGWVNDPLATQQLSQVGSMFDTIQEDLKYLRDEIEVLGNTATMLDVTSIEQAITAYVVRIEAAIVQSQSADRDESLFDEGTQVLEQVNALHEQIVVQLELLLNKRLATQYQYLGWAIAAILLTLFTMIFFSTSFYRSNQRAFAVEQESRKALELSQRALNRFKTTLDETMDCVFMFEPDTLKFFYVNAGAIAQVGYSSGELMDMTLVDINPEFDEQRFRETLAPMLEGKQDIFNFETRHQHKDGYTIPVEIFLQYIHPPGEPARFVAIVSDITERKRVDKMKNEFISTVSHELRTPLTSIRGSLGLINAGTVGELPEQAQEMFEIASNNTDRLLLLINDILDIQKIESGQMDFKFQSLDLMPFLEQALKENAAYGEQHGVKFVITQEVASAWVYADKDRLMQVMANLLSNAAKFSPENESVEISVARINDGPIRISVTDHGLGMPEEFQAVLFDKFTQHDSSDARQRGGTGLGLSIARIIVGKHGGHLDFVSREGMGTTFYIELPELKEKV